MREFERLVLLQVIDRKWREHLYEMDYLQEGIGLRAHAQRDPLVEYQREGFDMFSQMLDGIKEEVVGFLFNMEVQVEEAPPRAAGDRHAGGSAAARGEAGRDLGQGSGQTRASRRHCRIRRRRSTVRREAARSRSSRHRRSVWAARRRRRRGPADRSRPARRARRCPRPARSSAPADRRATRRAPAGRARSTSAATARRRAHKPPSPTQHCENDVGRRQSPAAYSVRDR